MAIIVHTNADGTRWPIVLVLAVLEENRSRTIECLDELIAQIDDLTARHVEGIRADGQRLGIDAARIERDALAFERRHEYERDWYLRQRAAALAGIPDLLIEPPQA